MTRDDAIRLLTNMKGYTHITLYEWLDVETEALDMAIEALSAKSEQTIRHIEDNTKESDLVYRPSADRPTTHTLPDGTEIRIDEESYEIGYTEGQMAARPTGEWFPFKRRPLTDEEKQEYPNWTYIFDCLVPDDEEEILLSDGKHVWTDTFINDGECYLDGGDDIDDGMAWMPLPEPYKGGGDE